MPTNANPTDVIADADCILKVWNANPDFKLKDVTLQQFQQDRADLASALAELKQKDDEMTPLRNQRDDLTQKINSTCTRARAGIKGYFGDNSSEYELAGGTRSSERQKVGPRAKQTSQPAK